MTKIKFLSNYDNSESLLKRFKANYFIYDNDLAFTIANDYDYAVVFNCTDEPVNPKAKVITIIQSLHLVKHMSILIFCYTVIMCSSMIPDYLRKHITCTSEGR